MDFYGYVQLLYVFFLYDIGDFRLFRGFIYIYVFVLFR